MNQADGEELFVGLWMTYVSTALGDLYTGDGRHDEASAMFDRSMAGYLARNREAGEGWGYLYDLARVHASLGERDEALRWLRRALQFGFPEVYLARIDPMMWALRGDAEYKQLLKELEELSGRCAWRSTKDVEKRTRTARLARMLPDRELTRHAERGGRSLPMAKSKPKPYIKHHKAAASGPRARASTKCRPAIGNGSARMERSCARATSRMASRSANGRRMTRPAKSTGSRG
jgi:tetratricopeptide (TPR) repeat protein